MARQSSFKKALNTIISYFENSSQKVFNYWEISGLLGQEGREWGLSETMPIRKFIENLLTHTKLRQVEIPAVGSQLYTSSKLVRFIYPDASPFEVALSLKSNTYLSHYSSMFLLGLTEQIPKVIYVTFEQSEKISTNISINQESIDKAFAKPQREPSHYYKFDEYKIILLNSKFSKKAGLTRSNSIFGQNLQITSLERTLIDITVRPAYSGGVTEVLKAYERAAGFLSVNKLISILYKLDYIYPYHQAIGFYLEKAKVYKERQINMLKEIDKHYDFYLTYSMSDKEYSKEWRLYYPKNF